MLSAKHLKLTLVALAATIVPACAQSTDAAQYAQQGLQFFGAQQFQSAIKSFDEAIRLSPSDASYFYYSGWAHQSYAYLAGSAQEREQELTEAERQFAKAVQLRSDYFDALIHLSNVQSELKKYSESLKNLQSALAVPGVQPADQARTQQAMAFVQHQLAQQQETSQPAASAPQAESESATAAESATPTASPAVVAEAPKEMDQSDSEGGDDFGVTPAAEAPSAPAEGATGSDLAFNGWTRYVDPSENSFSVEVPVGWKTEGGLTRVSAIDCRPWVKVTSPDNLFCAFIGDGTIAPCTMPNAQLSSLGFYPGRNYNGSKILAYIPARRFVEKYAFLKLKSVISNLQVVSESNHPDIAQAVNGTVGATRSECASIKITGDYGSIPASGYYIAATKATVMNGTGMWWVTYIAGNLGPAARDGAGLGVLLHMMGTFQMNPEWSKRSHDTTWRVSQNYRQTANQISNSIMNRYWSQQAANDRFNQAYWNRQAVQDKAAGNFSDYIRGDQTVADPQTGQQWKVNQANEHWMDSSGNITGTDYGGQPGPDWRKLNNVP